MARLAQGAVWNGKAWNTFLKGQGVRKFLRQLTGAKTEKKKKEKQNTTYTSYVMVAEHVI